LRLSFVKRKGNEKKKVKEGKREGNNPTGTKWSFGTART